MQPTMLINLVTSVLIFSAALGEMLLSMEADYEVMEKSADESSKMMVIDDFGAGYDCLMKCSKTDGCKSVVHEGTTCSLYNSTNGSVPLTGGQTAIGEVRRKESYGKY